MMKRADHANILRYIETLMTQNNIYIFFEYCNGGNLKQFINLYRGKMNEKVAKVILKQIAQGLSYLNEIDVVHRDLKLENILLHFPKWKGSKEVSNEYLMNFNYETDKFEVVICDFGFSKVVNKEELTKTTLGTPAYMAPEIHNKQEYWNKVDIWAFGVIMYQLLFGFFPFSGRNLNAVKDCINNGCYGLPKYISLSLHCFDLMNKWLQFDPAKRINHSEIVQHQFLVEEDNQQAGILMSTEYNKLLFKFPKNCKELNDDNSYMLNIKDSIFFKDIYSQAIYKINEVKDELNEEDEEKDVENNQLSAGSINNVFKMLYSSHISDSQWKEYELLDTESLEIISWDNLNIRSNSLKSPIDDTKEK